MTTPTDLDNELKRLLDNGWTIKIYRNQLGSYTASARHYRGRRAITDHFEPGEALAALVQKVFGEGIYST